MGGGRSGKKNPWLYEEGQDQGGWGWCEHWSSLVLTLMGVQQAASGTLGCGSTLLAGLSKGQLVSSFSSTAVWFRAAPAEHKEGREQGMKEECSTKEVQG